MFSSFRDYGSLETGSTRRARPTTYEGRRDEILKKNKALKRLRDKLSPEELQEIEQRERPFFNDLIKKSRGPAPTDLSLSKFIDPFGFLSKKQGDATEARVTGSSFSLTNDTYAGPNYVGLKHGDAKKVPRRKDFAVLTPNSTAHASRIHDLYFTLIGGIKDPEKRQRLRKLVNQYYSAQLASGIKNRNKEQKGVLELYLDHLRIYPDEDFSSFFQRQIHDDPQLVYHVAAALRNPEIRREEQELRQLHRQMKNRKGVSREQFEQKFQSLNNKIENYLSTVKRPDKVGTDQDPNQLTQVFYGDKSYSGLYDHDNLDVVFSGIMKAVDESLYTDDVPGIELAAKTIFERNKGNDIPYTGFTREEGLELLDVLKNEGDNRLAREITDAVMADLPSDIPEPLEVQEAVDPVAESLEPEAEIDDFLKEEDETDDQQAELINENEQPEKIEFQEQVNPKSAEFDNNIEELVDINIAQGDDGFGDPTLPRLQELYRTGVLDAEGLRSYLNRQPLSKLQKLVRN